MAIPIFMPGYLAQIREQNMQKQNTVARLLAQEGENIAKSIEQQAVQLEAKVAAPEVLGLYGKGMEAITQGDMRGFGLLAEAASRAPGNPILSRMVGDGVRQGAAAAQNVMQERGVQ
jgi:hypothetical protein